MLAGAFGDPARIVAAFETGTPTPSRRRSGRSPRRSSPATPLIFTGLAVAISFRGGHVQHRRRRPVHHGRARRDDRGVRAAGPGAQPGHPAARRWPSGPVGRVLGLHPRLPQGADRRPRGHHDDHAQLRRGPDRPLRAALTTPAPAGQHGADLEASRRLRRRPADRRPAGDPPPLRLHRRAGHGGRRVVAPVQDDQGLRAARRRAST